MKKSIKNKLYVISDGLGSGKTSVIKKLSKKYKTAEEAAKIIIKKV
ncbi:MAG: hypothetical protein QW117_00460 [Candidatus Pacearchaeota archaeon]